MVYPYIFQPHISSIGADSSANKTPAILPDLLNHMVSRSQYLGEIKYHYDSNGVKSLGVILPGRREKDSTLNYIPTYTGDSSITFKSVNSYNSTDPDFKYSFSKGSYINTEGIISVESAHIGNVKFLDWAESNEIDLNLVYYS